MLPGQPAWAAAASALGWGLEGPWMGWRPLGMALGLSLDPAASHGRSIRLVWLGIGPNSWAPVLQEGKAASVASPQHSWRGGGALQTGDL